MRTFYLRLGLGVSGVIIHHAVTERLQAMDAEDAFEVAQTMLLEMGDLGTATLAHVRDDKLVVIWQRQLQG